MPVLLTVIPKSSPPWHHVLWEDERSYDIGRSDENQIQIDEIQVSRHHARIEHREDGWWIDDQGSANGLVINGLKVDSAQLEGMSEVRIGDLVCRTVVLTRDQLFVAHQDRLDRFHRKLRETQATGDLESAELLDRLLRSSAQVCGASRGFVLLGRNASELELRASLNIDSSQIDSDGFSGSRSAVEKVLATGKPLVIADTSQDAFLTGKESIEIGRIRCLICLPLEGFDDLHGVVYLDSQEPGKLFDELDVEFLESLAGHAALALKVQTLRSELRKVRHRVQTDPVPRPTSSALAGGVNSPDEGTTSAMK